MAGEGSEAARERDEKVYGSGSPGTQKRDQIFCDPLTAVGSDVTNPQSSAECGQRSERCPTSDNVPYSPL
ncbi:unnamed protein product [Arctogadus glacialis]